VITGPSSVTALAVVSRLRPGAHHPDCYRYDHHLLRVGRRPLCLGCCCLWSGVALGLPTSTLVPPWWLVALGLALVAPTALQPYIQRKPFKIVARSMLGVGCAWYVLGLIVAPSWDPQGLAVRLAGAGLFHLLYRALRQLRQKRLNDPCAECPHGRKPFCLHYLPQFERLGQTAEGADDRALAAAMASHIRQQGYLPLPAASCHPVR